MEEKIVAPFATEMMAIILGNVETRYKCAARCNAIFNGILRCKWLSDPEISLICPKHPHRFQTHRLVIHQTRTIQMLRIFGRCKGIMEYDSLRRRNAKVTFQISNSDPYEGSGYVK